MPATGRNLVLSLLLGAVFWPGAAAAYDIRLPAFSLKDPGDKVYTEEFLKGKAAVLVVTIPNVKHGDVQQAWSHWLLKNQWAAEHTCLMYVQDLSQSNVKDKALPRMKERYKPDTMPILLLDHEGLFRRKLGVPVDTTSVLIFDKNGVQVFDESEPPSREMQERIIATLRKIQ